VSRAVASPYFPSGKFGAIPLPGKLGDAPPGKLGDVPPWKIGGCPP